jgi:Subtilase family
MHKKLGLLFLFLLVSIPLAADAIRLASGAFDPLQARLAIPDSLRAMPRPSGKDFYLLQFRSLPKESSIQELSRFARFHSYIPDNTYLIESDASTVELLRSRKEVRWIGIYHPFYKLSPEIGKRALSPSRRSAGFYYLSVELFPEANAQEAVELIRKLGGVNLSVHKHAQFTRVRVWLPTDSIDALANIESVQWIEEESQRTKRNNVTRWVIQSNIQDDTSIWDHNLHGEGQIIGHIDGLISAASCYFAEAGKILAIHNQSGDPFVDAHGTHTAGTAAGDRSTFDEPSNADGNAFGARLVHTNLCDLDPSQCDLNLPAFVTLEEALTDHHDEGARIHTNSWGDDSTTSYTADCRDIDRFSHENENDLVIFAVTNTSTLKTPENAKNVLAVGASKQAPNQNTIQSGGAGPTSDGRRKPEIYAPGQNIVSAKTSCGTTTKSGTSMAAPAIAAAASMVRQYYLDGFYPTGTKNSSDSFTPTGSLIKATLLNGTVDMTGPAGYPGKREGWGRLLLDDALYFAGDSRSLIVHDVRTASGFVTNSTATDTYNLTLASNQPLKITLVWIDPESPVGASGSLTNNLDLQVITSTGTFKGNVFANGQSTTGGVFDSVNNVEQVFLKSPSTGALTVKVTAANIPQGRQGYALVLTGGFSDCTPPSPPSNLDVTPSNSQNALTWNPLSGATYNVYRNTSGCSSAFSLIGSTSASSFTDSSLSNGTTYYYQVVAVAGGCASSPSNCGSGTPTGGSGGGEILFADNFEDGNDLGWTFTGGGTHSVNAAHQLVMNGATTLTAKPNFSGCDDCDLSLRLIIDAGSPAIRFPLIDFQNMRELKFMMGIQKVVLTEKIGGATTKSLTFPFALQFGQTYDVVFTNTGGNAGIIINGTPLALPVMTDFPVSTFSFVANNGTTRFDNVVVSQ